MVLKAFWGSICLLLGALGGLLGAPSGFWIDQRGPPDSSWNSLGPRLLASCCRRWPWEGSGVVFGSFYPLSEPPGAKQCGRGWRAGAGVGLPTFHNNNNNDYNNNKNNSNNNNNKSNPDGDDDKTNKSTNNNNLDDNNKQ